MWAQIINAALGLWLMAAPAVLGYDSPAADNDRVFGPVIATFAIVAWWETTRAVARWNLPLGLWLVLAPWILGYSATAPTVNSMVVGLLVAALSLVMGTFRPERFGGGWSAIWSENPPHKQAAKKP